MTFERWAGSERPRHLDDPSLALMIPSNYDAPALARRALMGLTNGYDDHFIADAQLLISEVVTNAVRHGGGGDIDVAVWAPEGALEAVVCDGGPGFTPLRSATSTNGNGGMGLEVVDTFCESRGSSHDAPGTVWFRVAVAS